MLIAHFYKVLTIVNRLEPTLENRPYKRAARRGHLGLAQLQELGQSQFAGLNGFFRGTEFERATLPIVKAPAAGRSSQPYRFGAGTDASLPHAAPKRCSSSAAAACLVSVCQRRSKSRASGQADRVKGVAVSLIKAGAQPGLSATDA